MAWLLAGGSPGCGGYAAKEMAEWCSDNNKQDSAAAKRITITTTCAAAAVQYVTHSCMQTGSSSNSSFNGRFGRLPSANAQVTRWWCLGQATLGIEGHATHG